MLRCVVSGHSPILEGLGRLPGGGGVRGHGTLRGFHKKAFWWREQGRACPRVCKRSAEAQTRVVGQVRGRQH